MADKSYSLCVQLYQDTTQSFLKFVLVMGLCPEGEGGGGQSLKVPMK